jgi:magnesium transporter
MGQTDLATTFGAPGQPDELCDGRHLGSLPPPSRRLAMGEGTTAEGEEPVLRISRSSAREEVLRRAPWIIFGLVAGLLMIALSKNFEQELARRIELTFFIPMIVYMSDNIGTETLALFVRELALQRVSLHKLFWREVVVGVSLGLITGLPMGVICYLWLGDFGLATTVAVAMIVNGAIAVLMGMLVPVTFARLRRDPAVGSDEISTAVSDVASLLVYLMTAMLILFW